MSSHHSHCWGLNTVLVCVCLNECAWERVPVYAYLLQCPSPRTVTQNNLSFTIAVCPKNSNSYSPDSWHTQLWVGVSAIYSQRVQHLQKIHNQCTDSGKSLSRTDQLFDLLSRQALSLLLSHSLSFSLFPLSPPPALLLPHYCKWDSDQGVCSTSRRLKDYH